MQHRQLSGLFLGGIGDVPPLAHHHGVAAGRILGVEPQVLAAGGVQSELFVL